MSRHLLRVDLRRCGRLPAAVTGVAPRQHRQVPRIAADGVTLIGGQCGSLAGQCMVTGPHFDHHGPAAHLVIPGWTGAPALEAELASWSDGTDAEPAPVISIGFGGNGCDLDADQALELAARAETFALRLTILARHLRAAQNTHQA